MTNSRAKKIVIADDDDAIADALRTILEFDGYEVVLTKDGETMQVIQDARPDLILLDIWMAGVDGRNICAELKKNVKTKHIPVLLVSASRNAHMAASDCNADGFIAKPFEMEVLLGKVSQAVHIA